jgi:hypothetical protein
MSVAGIGGRFKVLISGPFRKRVGDFEAPMDERPNDEAG